MTLFSTFQDIYSGCCTVAAHTQAEPCFGHGRRLSACTPRSSASCRRGSIFGPFLGLSTELPRRRGVLGSLHVKRINAFRSVEFTPTQKL
jgi:hypothetical protein